MLVLVDGSEYEEFEYLKSVKGKFFVIVFDESAIKKDITDARDDENAFTGVSTEVLQEQGAGSWHRGDGEL